MRADGKNLEVITVQMVCGGINMARKTESSGTPTYGV